jgi:zinc/manganese transport system substrate-binding protein
MRVSVFTLAFGIAVAVAGVAKAEPAPPVRAVASFSILGDLVHEVGGARVAVQTLVGRDADVHVFSPSPADARELAEASIVFVNGLGLEGGLDRLIRAANPKVPVIVASAGVAPLEGAGGEAGRRPDPHAWQSVPNAKLYVANIRDALARIDPPGASTYVANATAYLARLDQLDREIRAAVEALPPDRRQVVTTHRAFAYFAREYGLIFLAPEGLSTEAEPSAMDIARLVRQVRQNHVTAMFAENISDRRMIQQVAAETGARLGPELYSDALSAVGGPAATYIDMIRYNVRAITGALAP